MSQDRLISRPEYGRTFATALWVLGLVAGLQVLAAGWAILTRPFTGPKPAAVGEESGAPVPSPRGAIAAPLVADARIEAPWAPIPPEETPQLPNPAATVSGGGGFSFPDPAEAVGTINASPSIGGGLGDSLMPGPRFSGPEPLPALSTLPSEAALAAPAPLRIPDPEVSAMVDQGAERRASGDMQGALDALRQAEALLPEHPRVLSEIAATYEELGLDRKAILYWERVRDLGAGGAGVWHGIASDELNDRRAKSAEATKVLRLGKITTLHDPAIRPDQGERVVLTVSVEAIPGSRPSAAEMSMHVYFYDLVNGDKAEESTADVPPAKFVSAPYDWQAGGVETMEVTYHQPVFSEEQKRKLGERVYYGYIVELYYRNQLQDRAAFPPDLSRLDPAASPSPLTETPPGPENSLFPAVPNEE